VTGSDVGRRAQLVGGEEDRAQEPASIPCNFTVAIGSEEIGFCSVSRLSSQSAVGEPVETPGEAPRAAHRYANAVLRRALSADRRLFLWRQNILAGESDKRRVTIRQLDAAGLKATHIWVLEGAWPCRWAGPAFDATAKELATEEVELAFDQLIWR
jgi:phage tail-like protein